MNPLVRFGLGVANMPAGTIADIEKNLPAAERLDDAAKLLAPMLQQAQPHIEAMLPLIDQAKPHLAALQPMLAQALPILKAAYPDMFAILPTAKEIIAFVEGNKVA